MTHGIQDESTGFDFDWLINFVLFWSESQSGRGNNIGYEGALAIADALCINTTLVTFKYILKLKSEDREQSLSMIVDSRSLPIIS